MDTRGVDNKIDGVHILCVRVAETNEKKIYSSFIASVIGIGQSLPIDIFNVCNQLKSLCRKISFKAIVPFRDYVREMGRKM